MKRPSKALIDKWYKKAAKAGHVEIEELDAEERMKKWHDFYFRRRFTAETFAARQRYFELAQQWLVDGYFTNGTEKKLWELHTQGLYLMEIADKLNMSKTKVHGLVKKIRSEAGIIYASSEKK